MKPCYLAMIVGVFFELFVTANVAQPCGKCGVFGRGCRYSAPVYHAKPYVAPVVVKAPDNISTFIFNNVADPGFLAARSDTVYGVSRALEYSAPSSALYLDNTRRLIETAS
jgi:hypothetical protein